jgi:TolA-binding protein
LFPTVPERVAGKGSVGSRSRTEAFDDAMHAYKQGQYADAEQRFDAVARSSDPGAASAELYAARAAQRSSGCGSAVERFESVATRHSGTEIGHEASWLAAECHRQLGSPDRAATTYRELLDAPGYGDKAKRALAAMSQPASEPATAAGRAAPSKPAATSAAESAP